MYLQIEKLEFAPPTIEAVVQTGAKIPSTEIWKIILIKKQMNHPILIISESICQNNDWNNTPVIYTVGF